MLLLFICYWCKDNQISFNHQTFIQKSHLGRELLHDEASKCYAKLFATCLHWGIRLLVIVND